MTTAATLEDPADIQIFHYDPDDLEFNLDKDPQPKPRSS